VRTLLDHQAAMAFVRQLPRTNAPEKTGANNQKIIGFTHRSLFNCF
jgi:hypothetical protein